MIEHVEDAEADAEVLRFVRMMTEKDSAERLK